MKNRKLYFVLLLAALLSLSVLMVSAEDVETPETEIEEEEVVGVAPGLRPSISLNYSSLSLGIGELKKNYCYQYVIEWNNLLVLQ